MWLHRRRQCNRRRSSFVSSVFLVSGGVLLGCMTVLSCTSAELKETRRKAKIDQLEKQVARIPVAQYQKNLEIYQELRRLNPENERYRRKVEFYKTKLLSKKREAKRPKTPLSIGKSKSHERQSRKYYVSSNKLRVYLKPHKDARVTNVLDKGQQVAVFEERNGWARISRYYDGEVEGLIGSVARWVSRKHMTKVKPKSGLADYPTMAHSDESQLEVVLKKSDDFGEHRNVFLRASRELIAVRKCSLSDFEYSGGWVRSPKYRPRAVYFMYCGKLRVSNRIYLDAKTGEMFH